MQPLTYVDLRCLQDANYRVRGIGQHVAALLRTRHQSGCANWRVIGLLDPSLPPPPDEIVSLVSEITYSLNPCCNGSPILFIDGTPMTHDTSFSIRFQSHPTFINAAVIYDFIPLDWDGYLASVSSRVNYLAKLGRLRKFDLFFPISEYSAWRLSELLGVSRNRIHVTGASVRGSLYEISARPGLIPRPYDAKEPYFAMVSADDTRKNAEIAVRAVRQLNLIYSRRISLKVIGHFEGSYKTVGHYGDHYKQDLLRLAGHAEGEGFLEFCPNISDEELVSVIAGAIATIAPSHIEGFSLPVVEAVVCACPVIASTCAAHLELIDQPEALFLSSDVVTLTERLDALLNAPGLRADLVASQRHLGARFHEAAVGERFWNGLQNSVEKRWSAPGIIKNSKPRLAFLSPFPPDQSGVARYTALTIQAGRDLFESNLYSDATRPLAFEGSFVDAGRVSLAPLVSGSYNGVISVLGNSHFHKSIFEIFERYGGPCILHDAWLIQIYLDRLGHQEFLKFVSNLLKRTVPIEEVHTWVQGRSPASTLLELIVERASPLIVHTKTQQSEIKKRYGIEAHVAPSCPTVFFEDKELTESAKQSARARYGISPDTFLVSSFGIVGPEKGMDTCILAIELLRSWNIPAELYFVGKATTFKEEVDKTANWYGIERHVHCWSGFVDDLTYRDFLLASDAAVQLRTYAFGQLSAALTDCISAGVPVVASLDLALSCDAPTYISTVPDRFSPLQVAEKLALIWENRSERSVHGEARADYLATHNFHYYAKRLTEILGIA